MVLSVLYWNGDVKPEVFGFDTLNEKLAHETTVNLWAVENIAKVMLMFMLCVLNSSCTIRTIRKAEKWKK